MKKQQFPIDDNEVNYFTQSCPPMLQQDITKSVNQQQNRAAQSQNNFPKTAPSFIFTNKNNLKSAINEHLDNRELPEKPSSDIKPDPNIINRKGTDFDCQKVQTTTLHQLNQESNQKSQQRIQQPCQNKINLKNHSQLIEEQRPEQIKQEILNVLIAGAQQTGKTTFIKCFKKKKRKINEPYIRPRTKQMKQEKSKADQNLLNRRNNVHFIEFPGFKPNNQDQYLKQIKQYSQLQWRKYKARPQQDKRIHCCLYFLRGLRIKQVDIIVMKKLSEMFCVIPVIAKSDQYTIQEILEIKQEFHKNVSQAAPLHLYDIEEYYRLVLGTDKIGEAIKSNFGQIPPFAVAASEQIQSPQSGKFVRKYAWGTLQISNPEHTDFQRLCEFLSEDIKRKFLNKMVQFKQIQQDKIKGQKIDEQNLINSPAEIGSSTFNYKDSLIVGSFLLVLVFIPIYVVKMKRNQI